MASRGFAVEAKMVSPAILPSLNKSWVEISQTQINFGIAISQYTFELPNGKETVSWCERLLRILLVTVKRGGLNAPDKRIFFGQLGA